MWLAHSVSFADADRIGRNMQNRGKSLDPRLETSRLRAPAAGLIGLWGAYQIALGVYFIALRPPLLPEDLRYVGLGRQALAALPRLEPWLHLVFTVLGGQMAAVGMLATAAALRIGRHREASVVSEALLLGMAGALSAGLMSAVNFTLGSDFRWPLILPVGVLALGLVLTLASRRGFGDGAAMQDPPAK
jgi:hypothetical protein